MVKKKLWIIYLTILPLSADLSIGQMEAMVEKIKAKRVGIEMVKDSNLTSPFVTIKIDNNQSILSNTEKKEAVFILGAIMNDKAFINKQWVQKGTMIEGYLLKEVEDDSVTLTEGERTIRVFLKKSKSILKINEG